MSSSPILVDEDFCDKDDNNINNNLNVDSDGPFASPPSEKSIEEEVTKAFVDSVSPTAFFEDKGEDIDKDDKCSPRRTTSNDEYRTGKNNLFSCRAKEMLLLSDHFHQYFNYKKKINAIKFAISIGLFVLLLLLFLDIISFLSSFFSNNDNLNFEKNIVKRNNTIANFLGLGIIKLSSYDLSYKYFLFPFFTTSLIIKFLFVLLAFIAAPAAWLAPYCEILFYLDSFTKVLRISLYQLLALVIISLCPFFNLSSSASPYHEVHHSPAKNLYTLLFKSLPPLIAPCVIGPLFWLWKSRHWSNFFYLSGNPQKNKVFNYLFAFLLLPFFTIICLYIIGGPDCLYIKDNGIDDKNGIQSSSSSFISPFYILLAYIRQLLSLISGVGNLFSPQYNIKTYSKNDHFDDYDNINGVNASNNLYQKSLLVVTAGSPLHYLWCLIITHSVCTLITSMVLGSLF